MFQLLDSFSDGFFNEFMGGMFADSPAIAVIILIIIIGVILYFLAKKLDE